MTVEMDLTVRPAQIAIRYGSEPTQADKSEAHGIVEAVLRAALPSREAMIAAYGNKTWAAWERPSRESQQAPSPQLPKPPQS